MNGTFADINNKFLGYGISAIAAVIAIFVFFIQYNHTKNTYYTGHVVEKYVKKKSALSYFLHGRRYRRRYLYGRNEKYYLEIETVDGKDVKVNVPVSLYRSVEVGDSIEKIEGEIYPRVIEVEDGGY